MPDREPQDWDYGRTWYHGSSLQLSVLRPGTTITQDRRLAEVFSHGPSWVSLQDDGLIKHNGSKQGWLHVIDESIGPEDIYPHPESVLASGDEWMTRRPLCVRMVRAVEFGTAELLTPEEIEALEKKWRQGRAAD